MKTDPISNLEPKDVPILQSFILRLVMGSGFLAMALLVSNTVWSYEYERRQVINEFRHNTMAIGLTIAPYISSNNLREYVDNSHASTDSFKVVQAELKQLQEDNVFAEEQIYILRKDLTLDNTYRFSVMLQEQTFVGDPYSPPTDVADMYGKAWNGIPQSTPMFTDDHGTFVAALIPLRNQNDEVVGILELDRNLEDYLNAFVEDILIRLLIELIFFFLWLFLGIWMYRNAKSRVDDLLQGTIAIQEANYEYRIPVEKYSPDEFTLLGRAINISLSQLGERFSMLKFLPKHTLKMIAYANEQQSEVALNMVRNVECVIMETDIRGFTALTENLSPHDTIKLVNEFIENQAEIIIMDEYSGSIDKYMGDAVLVIFEGDNKERRAYECAHHIQYSLRQLNKRKRRKARKRGEMHTNVEIGIGLSVGHVIMGNMGCEERMEHTVIGSTVNLAARLCSAAKGGEIVIHQDILEPIGKQGVYEEIQVKGFSQPVPVRRLTKSDTTSNLTYCSGIYTESIPKGLT